MQTLLLFITDPNRPEAKAALPASPDPFWTGGSVILCAVGLLVLIGWQFWYGGFDSLRKAPPRRNRLPVFLPMILLGVWILLMGVLLGGTDQDGLQMGAYLKMAAMETALIGVMLLLACRLFARRLRGFGFNPRTLVRDVGIAVVNLLGVCPLILLGLWTTLNIGRLFNPDFNLEVHQSIETLTDSDLGLRLIVAFFAVFIVPVFEEMLFRGFLQTSLRSLTGHPWQAIVITSLLFSILHPPTHMAALFMLSCGLGYGYERGGSLFRPILMHIFFNGMSVAVTLLFPAAS
ncbi:MAG: CPBP family intramembrane metalloprotease [Planctomycetales bacterium]|nr:CPBP family intramembrane metalloprotease [Planctomycetales bacterium]